MNLLNNKNTIHILKAQSGDCFLIELEDKNCILIDSGYRNTYYSELKPLLKNLASQNYRISLFVVTHYDEDHISGAIAFIEENGNSNNPQIIPVDNIWFNGIYSLVESSSLLKSHLSDHLTDCDRRRFFVLCDQLYRRVSDGDGYISACKAQEFEELCSVNKYKLNLGATDGRIVSGAEMSFGNCYVKCLNPSHDRLKQLEKWINHQCIECLGEGYSIENNSFLSFLRNMLLANGRDDLGVIPNEQISCTEPDISKWIGTSSLANMNEVNRASIVVEILYKGKSLLFTGDSESEDWIDEARSSYDFVKISHHGTTKPNIKLIERIKFPNAIISTNGRRYHPEDELLGRLLLARVRRIYFNYEDLRQKDELIALQNKYSCTVFFGKNQISF